MTSTKKESTQQVFAELIEIGESNDGVVDPHEVVDFARNPDTALHSQFIWDDSKAAEKYRVIHARTLIRRYTFPVKEDRPKSQEVKHWVSLQNERKRGKGSYREVRTVIANPTLRSSLLRQAYGELQSFVKRFQAFEELAEVFSAIEKFGDNLQLPEEKEEGGNKGKGKNKGKDD